MSWDLSFFYSAFNFGLNVIQAPLLAVLGLAAVGIIALVLVRAFVKH